MTKQEFLEKLAALLQDIPAEEREAALEFYRGYFDDAGEGREAEVIRELESPEKVAEQIKNGLKTGLGTDSYENAGSPYDKNTSSRPVPENYGSYEKQPKKSSGWRTFGIVCLVLFIGIPIGIPVLVTVFALALSALVCVALLAVAVAMVMAAGFFAGIVFLVVGVARLALAPGVALMFCGSGFISDYHQRRMQLQHGSWNIFGNRTLQHIFQCLRLTCATDNYQQVFRRHDAFRPHRHVAVRH